MDQKLGSSFAPRSYQDFVPPSDWIREQGFDKLVMELPGFRKEQLKIQLDNFGNLRTTGERPLNGNRWQRFRKEFRIPDNCNANEIRAKFENGVLTVTLPKLTTTPSEPPTQPEPATTTTPATRAEPTPTVPPTKAELTAPMPPTARAPDTQTASEREHEPRHAAEAAKGEVKEEKLLESKREEKAAYGVSGLLPVGMKRKRKQLLVSVAMAVIVLVGVGIYVAYRFRKLAEAETAAELHYEL